MLKNGTRSVLEDLEARLPAGNQNVWCSAFYFRASIMALATFVGTIAYSENSIVELALPSVILRSWVT